MTPLQPTENRCFKPSKYSYAYLMITKSNNIPILKVGKANSPNQRLTQLKKEYNRQYFLVKTWTFRTIEDAYEMEIWLHRFYKAKHYELVGQDHFLNCIPYQEEMKILNEKAEEIKINSQKWLDKIK